MAVVTVPVLIIGAIATSSIGAFIGSQFDDAVEVFTGEKDVFPLLPVLLVVGLILFIFLKTREG